MEAKRAISIDDWDSIRPSQPLLGRDSSTCELEKPADRKDERSEIPPDLPFIRHESTGDEPLHFRGECIDVRCEVSEHRVVCFRGCVLYGWLIECRECVRLEDCRRLYLLCGIPKTRSEGLICRRGYVHLARVTETVVLSSVSISEIS